MTNSITHSIPDLLQTAVQLHRQGNLNEANVLYEQILSIDPWHFDALHFSGLIAKQTGHPDRAIELIGTAIRSCRTDFNATHASAFCNLGATYQECHQPEMALTNYQRALQLKPDYAMAHNNLGNALKNLGRLQEAVASYRRAADFAPDYPEAYYHCGLALHLMGRFDQALEQFDRALQFRPAYAQAWHAAGITLHSLGRFDNAIENYNRAIHIMPEFAQAYFNRAICYNRLQEFGQAVTDFEQAIRCQPNYPNAYFYLGNALRQLNKSELAITAYRRARELGADAGQVDFMLATLGAGTTPDAPPAAYVRELFDQYAEHFDTHLTKVLKYTVPALIASVLTHHIQSRQLNCLDLGCGTGLCAPFLRHYAGQLSGVDLSQNMLNQAARLNLYDSLVCADMADYLFTADQRFDLITAADVLVYLGDLNRVIHGVSVALSPGGLFCFSVEYLKQPEGGDDYVLQTTARYAHSEAYLRKLALLHNLTVLELHQHTGREENQIKSEALIVLLQKVAGKKEN